MELSQTITPSEAGLLAERKVEKPNVAGGTVSAAVGGNGIRPAGQVAYSMDKKDGNDRVTAGATATVTVGQGISASAYGMYEINSADGKTQTRLGLSAEYNRSASVSVGGRVDYQTGATVNAPVVGQVGVSVYGSAIASTDSKKTGAEAGVCGTGSVGSVGGTACVGVRRDGQGNTSVTVGFGTKF